MSSNVKRTVLEPPILAQKIMAAHVTTEKAEAAAAKAAMKALKKTHGEMQDIPFAQLQKLQERIGVKRFRGAGGVRWRVVCR